MAITSDTGPTLDGLFPLAEDLMRWHGHDPAAHLAITDEIRWAIETETLDIARQIITGHGLTIGEWPQSCAETD
jgi:hypothetical protein